MALEVGEIELAATDDKVTVGGIDQSIGGFNHLAQSVCALGLSTNT